MLWRISTFRRVVRSCVSRTAAGWCSSLIYASLASLIPVFIASSCITASRSSTVRGDSCLELTPESTLNPVRVCESNRYYHVYVLAKEHRYEKLWFRQTLREQISQFTRRNAYDAALLAQSTIEIWFQVPVFHPEDTKLVAVVLGPAGNFAVPLSLDPNHWTVASDGVLLLGKAAYPSGKAHRSGTIVVQARGHVKPLAFHHFLSEALTRFPATKPALDEQRLAYSTPRQEPTHNWPVFLLETAAFSERAVAAQLVRAPRARYYLEDVTLLPARESDGKQLRFISFPFRSNGPSR